MFVVTIMAIGRMSSGLYLAAAMADGGALPAAILVTGSVRAHRDKLRILATTGATRNASFPDVLTLRDQGFDLVVEEWLGVFAPKGTPAATVNAVNKSINEALRAEKTRSAMEILGFPPAPISQQEFASTVASDIQRW